METNNKQLSLFTNENIAGSLLKLGLPTMIGLLVSALYNVADTYFVGGLGTAQVAAVSVVFPLNYVILGVSLLFGIGGSTCVSKLLGAKQYKKANECATTAIFSSLALSIIMVVLLIIFLDPVLRILGISDNSIVFGRQYGFLFLISLAINGFNASFDNLMAGEGANLYAMISMLSGGLLNIILDPILIYNAGMGVRGAAVATIISNVFIAALYITYILRKKGVLRYSLKYIKLSSDVYINLTKVGMPMLLFETFQYIALALTNFLASSYGDSPLAGINITTKITSLIFMALCGFTKGYQPFVGYNYGAKRMDRVNKSTSICLKMTTAFCIATASICFFLSPQIIDLFSKTDTVLINTAIKSLKLNSILIISCGFEMVYACKFLATNNIVAGGLVTFARQGIFFIPLIFLLSHFAGLNGIIYTQPLADMLSLVLLVILKIKDDERLETELAMTA